MSKPLGPTPAVKSPAVYALIEKRSDIAGEIEATQLRLRKLLAQLDHIDFTIRIFDAGYALDQIRTTPKIRYAFRGRTQTIILDALRAAGRPVATSALALKLIADRGLAADDNDILRLFTARANATLQRLAEKKLTRRAGKVGKQMEWELAV